ncbi:MAG TPA: hypothetical protein VFP00_02385 [Burkholderiales bacterium]|nr:hypothetical protein [Burkholderiales bacterium]
MAIGWLTVLKALPWKTIISQAPTVVDAANRLLSQTRRKPPAPGSQSDFGTLVERIDALEEHDRADAAVMKQLAEEVAALARASQVIAVRMRLVLVLGVIAIVVSMVAIGLVLSR